MKIKDTAIILSIILFAACDDNDIDVPRSSISGEITGTYTSGTPFEESFLFIESSGNVEKFEDIHQGKFIQITRTQGSSYFSMGLVLQDVGLPTEKLTFLDNKDVSAGEFDFFLQKETSPSTLSEISCKGIATSIFFRSMSLEENKKYELVVNADGDPVLFGKSSVYYKPALGGEGYWQHTYTFKNTSGAEIYFVSDIWDEAPFRKIKYPDGTESTTHPLYQDLYYLEIASATDQFRRKTSSGYDRLYEHDYKQDGSASILNHSYDPSNGSLKFDFEITVSGSSANNSSGHDLTITGKFDSGDRKIFLETQN